MSITQMTAKTLNAFKGWPNPHAVDFHAPFDPSVTDVISKVDPGMVVRLSSGGKYLVGLGSNNVMPLFVFQGSESQNVADNGGGNPATDAGNWISFLGQNCMALPAKGAYELVSTAYVVGQLYPPNTYLTSPTSGVSAGKLTPGTLGTDMICGQVSRGLVNNGYGKQAVAFWPLVLPVYP